MAERLKVDAPARLLDFLRARLPGWKRKTLEQRLRGGQVEVNGAVVERPQHALRAGDEVALRPGGGARAHDPRESGLSILHADEHLIAIDKPAGLLSVPLEQRRGRNALALLRAALSAPGRPARLWPVHRLDRESSGVLLFARTSAARDAVQESWSAAQKLYLAVVEGRPEPPAGRIEQPLWEDVQLRVHVGQRAGSKPARTRYSTLRSAGGRSLLEVELDAGRRHQIRAHLAWLGHPIVGDPRQGAAATRMGLHSKLLMLAHPASGAPLRLEAPAPRDFLALMR